MISARNITAASDSFDLRPELDVLPVAQTVRALGVVTARADEALVSLHFYLVDTVALAAITIWVMWHFGCGPWKKLGNYSSFWLTYAHLV